jgi:tRNA (adenine37-N6)-methyltransferase
MGLSVVKLERVEVGETGVRLFVSGVDAVDGTPVLDIKPYVPYADVVASAVGGFAQAEPQRLTVRWCCKVPDDAPSGLIEQSLSLNPAPAYQQEPERVYKAAMSGWEVAWRVDAEGVAVLNCSRAASRIAK